MTHIDDFIDHYKTDPAASWFFNLHRMPAMFQAKCEKWINQWSLFCTYEGERYRVTGCSCLGDVWLTKNFEQSTGYQKRVSVDDCSEWDLKQGDCEQ